MNDDYKELARRIGHLRLQVLLQAIAIVALALAIIKNHAGE